MIQFLDIQAPNHAKDTSIEQIAAEILYRYLVLGDSLKQIENDLFGTVEFSGWLSKCILNFYEVDTAPKAENRGVFNKLSLSQAIETLLKTDSPAELAIAKTLILLPPSS